MTPEATHSRTTGKRDSINKNVNRVMQENIEFAPPEEYELFKHIIRHREADDALIGRIAASFTNIIPMFTI